MYHITNSHGGRDLGVPFVKGVFQIPISPLPSDPHNHRARVVDMRPLSPSTWGHGALRGHRPPKHPPSVEGMWPGTVQEGGGSLTPPIFLWPARLRARIRGLVWIFGGNSTPFLFVVEFPLKPTPDLKGLEWIFGGNPTYFFLNLMQGSP